MARKPATARNSDARNKQVAKQAVEEKAEASQEVPQNDPKEPTNEACPSQLAPVAPPPPGPKAEVLAPVPQTIPGNTDYEYEVNPTGPRLPNGMIPPPTDRPVRVYADGIYDMFHFGHARALEQAKKAFPNTHLIVGCCSDKLTHEFKGKTVMTEQERYESLRHCRWIDEIVMDAPWVITEEFMKTHRIDYVAHDALPYVDTSGTASSGDVYAWVKQVGRFKETQRTEGVSTSDLIMRIVRDYNVYVLRNLKRGMTRKELHVSYLKEKQLKLGTKLSSLRQKVRDQQKRMGRSWMDHVEEVRKKGVKAFTDNVENVVHRVTQGKDLHALWTHNTDKLLKGFLDKFSGDIKYMETAVKRFGQGCVQTGRSLLRQNGRGSATRLAQDSTGHADKEESDDEELVHVRASRKRGACQETNARRRNACANYVWSALLNCYQVCKKTTNAWCHVSSWLSIESPTGIYEN
eukprot:jgi/Mesvir1/17229/Mv07643-RA.1